MNSTLSEPAFAKHQSKGTYMSHLELGQGDEVLPPLTEQEGDGQNGS